MEKLSTADIGMAVSTADIGVNKVAMHYLYWCGCIYYTDIAVGEVAIYY